MILLDTNYLINVLIPDTIEAQENQTRYREDQLCTSAICWYEFTCGPVNSRAIQIIENLLQNRIIPFNQLQAEKSSELFNKSGRLRQLRVDSMIAAAAIIENAELATANINDFRKFTNLGLKLH